MSLAYGLGLNESSVNAWLSVYSVYFINNQNKPNPCMVNIRIPLVDDWTSEGGRSMYIYATSYELWSETEAAWRGRDARHDQIIAHHV